jgi:flagellin
MAQRHLEGTRVDMEKAMERLASGKRINSAGDDAAGLGIRDRMTAQIKSINQSVRNANDSMSLAQAAEGAMEEVTSILNRVRELAVQASNSTYSSNDRKSVNEEVTLLVAEINRISTDTEFNGIKIMDGTFTSQKTMIGTLATHTTSLSIGSLASSTLGVGSNSSYDTSITSGAMTAVLAAGDVTINGYQVGASSADGVSYASSTFSAISVASAINAVSNSTNVSASVNATTIAGGTVTTAGAAAANGYALAIAAGDILINGVDIGAIAASGSVAERGGTVAAAVNAVSSQTGVTATFNTTTGAVALTAEDGRNISIGTLLTTADAATVAGGTGLTATVAVTTAATTVVTSTTLSTVALNSKDSAGITIGGESAGDGGLTDGYTAATATAGAGVSSLDLTTQSTANSALATIDSAINQVALERGKLGAFTNRLEHTVNNLMVTSENTAAARGRINDADFASESANLAKAQVLQQAGTAMLAQANASSQNVLSLLK